MDINKYLTMVGYRSWVTGVVRHSSVDLFDTILHVHFVRRLVTGSEFKCIRFCEGDVVLFELGGCKFWNVDSLFVNSRWEKI